MNLLNSANFLQAVLPYICVRNQERCLTNVGGRKIFLRGVLVKTAVYFLTGMEGFFVSLLFIEGGKICS